MDCRSCSAEDEGNCNLVHFYVDRGWHGVCEKRLARPVRYKSHNWLRATNLPISSSVLLQLRKQHDVSILRRDHYKQELIAHILQHCYSFDELSVLILKHVQLRRWFQTKTGPGIRWCSKEGKRRRHSKPERYQNLLVALRSWSMAVELANFDRTFYTEPNNYKTQTQFAKLRLAVYNYLDAYWNCLTVAMNPMCRTLWNSHKHLTLKSGNTDVIIIHSLIVFFG